MKSSPGCRQTGSRQVTQITRRQGFGEFIKRRLNLLDELVQRCEAPFAVALRKIRHSALAHCSESRMRQVTLDSILTFAVVFLQPVDLVKKSGQLEADGTGIGLIGEQ